MDFWNNPHILLDLTDDKQQIMPRCQIQYKPFLVPFVMHFTDTHVQYLAVKNNNTLMLTYIHSLRISVLHVRMWNHNLCITLPIGMGITILFDMFSFKNFLLMVISYNSFTTFLKCQIRLCGILFFSYNTSSWSIYCWILLNTIVTYMAWMLVIIGVHIMAHGLFSVEPIYQSIMII